MSLVRDCHSFVDSCNFTNKANSHTPKVEIHTRPKLCHFGRYVLRGTLFCLKVSSRSPSRSVHKGNFHLGYRDLGRKKRDLGNRASPASHMNTSIFLQVEEGEARSRKPSQPGMKRP